MKGHNKCTTIGGDRGTQVFKGAGGKQLRNQMNCRNNGNFVKDEFYLEVRISWYQTQHHGSLAGPLCRDHERSNLLQFKESFVIDQSASIEPTAYPKVASWTLEGNNSDCCSWDGVECDEVTGHVIGLDLNSSCLYGSINSNSSLFHLFLHLNDCGLHGEFPIGIFKLPNLQVLDVQYNKGLTGYLPDFQQSSPLEEMLLANTSFSGKLPASMGNLGSLTAIDTWNCNFSGNKLTGQIPFGLTNLTQLTFLELVGNNLAGQIPSSINNLKNLEFLDLSSNNFSGTVEFDKFVKLKKLTTLHLSYNGISLLTSETSGNTTLQKFQNLGLYSCNLSKFPDFLANQDELQWLDLGDNNFHGQVPGWFWNVSKESLEVIDLSDNFLTSLGQHPILLPWTRLAILDLRSNKLQGSLPIPSFSTLRLLGIKPYS
uniref:Uncharacterized protein n=1 Tax=Fagus sylvatica TaxID=28930 RepID=A0A2N9FFH9_FAGSY